MCRSSWVPLYQRRRRSAAASSHDTPWLILASQPLGSLLVCDTDITALCVIRTSLHSPSHASQICHPQELKRSQAARPALPPPGCPALNIIQGSAARRRHLNQRLAAAQLSCRGGRRRRPAGTAPPCGRPTGRSARSSRARTRRRGAPPPPPGSCASPAGAWQRCVTEGRGVAPRMARHAAADAAKFLRLTWAQGQRQGRWAPKLQRAARGRAASCGVGGWPAAHASAWRQAPQPPRSGHAATRCSAGRGRPSGRAW